MSAVAGEYGEPVFGQSFDFFGGNNRGRELELRTLPDEPLTDGEATQAISMGVTRQAFRDATTLRSSGRDFSPTTYRHLGKVQQVIARYRQRGMQPPEETNLFSSRIAEPKMPNLENLRILGRVPVVGAATLLDVPYVPGPQDAPRSQLYRTVGRAAHDQRRADSRQPDDEPVINLKLEDKREAAAQRLIEAWKDHCDHEKDERITNRNHRIFMASAITAGALAIGGSAAWALYEFFINR